MYIYKITNNLNGKSYVGLKSKTVEESEDYYGSGKLINQAIDKYGKENFTKEIIERNINSHEILNDQEIYWIEYFDTFNRGYNLTKGGQGNLGRVASEETKKKQSEGAKRQFRTPMSEETRKKISEKAKLRKGRTVSDETRKKLSNKQIGRVKGPREIEKLKKAFAGRKHTEETKKKISASKKNKPYI